MLNPCGDRILVTREQKVTQSPGGIYIPDVSAKQPNRGVITAIGPKVKNYDLAVGATVIFGEFAGMELSVDGNAVLVLHEDDVVGVFT